MVLPTAVLPTTLVMLGAEGAVVSMIVVTELLAALWFNAASVAFAVRVYVPAVTEGVYSQAPEPFAMAVPRTDTPL